VLAECWDGATGCFPAGDVVERRPEQLDDAGDVDLGTIRARAAAAAAAKA